MKCSFDKKKKTSKIHSLGLTVRQREWENTDMAPWKADGPCYFVADDLVKAHPLTWEADGATYH